MAHTRDALAGLPQVQVAVSSISNSEVVTSNDNVDTVGELPLCGKNDKGKAQAFRAEGCEFESPPSQTNDNKQYVDILWNLNQWIGEIREIAEIFHSCNVSSSIT